MKRLLALWLVGCAPTTVVRIVDGVPVEGRFVTDVAYAAYLFGAELEARELPEEALRAYAIAAQYDPESVEILVRMGALRCRVGKDEDAADAFAEAEAIDAGYEPLWRERALCAEARGALAEAVAHAERAHHADPDRLETTLLYARLLDAAKRHDEAARYLRSLSIRHPHRLAVWEAIAAHAALTEEVAWQLEAASHVERLGPNAREASDWEVVDAALRARDLVAARRAVLRGRLDPRALAARAILVGRPRLAVEAAELRLAADPDDADARVALALANDILGDRTRAAAILAELPTTAAPLGPGARILMAELLWRQVGREEATLFLGRAFDSTHALRTALAESFLGG